MVDLRRFAKGAGCGLKLPSTELGELLAGLSKQMPTPPVLVGVGAKYDYGAVYLVNSPNALVQSTDVLAPVCSSAKVFGEIVVCHTLSDIFAAGASPLCAVAILVLPEAGLPLDIASELLDAASDRLCKENAHLLGGHTIRTGENLLFGLAATGLANSIDLLSPGGARADDVLILTKALGTGLYVAADRQGYPGLDFSVAVESMRQSNHCIAQLREQVEVHAVVDVSGYGLSDALSRLAVHSDVMLTVNFSTIPLFPQVRSLARLGFHTRLTDENYFSTQEIIRSHGVPQTDLAILSDPQTSGGLLFAVSRSDASSALEICRRAKQYAAQAIGFCSSGEPVVNVTA